MNRTIPALVTALFLAASPLALSAATQAEKAEAKASAAALKKAAKDNTCAENWKANAKTLGGKKVTTRILEVGEMGLIASDAPYAVIPVSTCDKSGGFGGDLLALIPVKDVEGFAKKVGPQKSGQKGAFGEKITYPEIKGTFAVIEGEPVLVLMPTVPATKTKPSETLAAQLAAQPSGETAAPAETKTSAPAKETKGDAKKDAKKPAR